MTKATEAIQHITAGELADDPDKAIKEFGKAAALIDELSSSLAQQRDEAEVADAGEDEPEQGEGGSQPEEDEPEAEPIEGGVRGSEREGGHGGREGRGGEGERPDAADAARARRTRDRGRAGGLRCAEGAVRAWRRRGRVGALSRHQGVSVYRGPQRRASRTICGSTESPRP